LCVGSCGIKQAAVVFFDRHLHSLLLLHKAQKNEATIAIVSAPMPDLHEDQKDLLHQLAMK
jgi:hypothetical protein